MLTGRNGAAIPATTQLALKSAAWAGIENRIAAAVAVVKSLGMRVRLCLLNREQQDIGNSARINELESFWSRTGERSIPR
ncbi:hypothetical protein [Breoghania sp. L-A4]|uniref:hypothetical protein n=1 Tax=Breoghania sp. L-A4 TaxID=2304600 RepID=UPI0013C30A56|nr:hypothetical protein [Breoghania sp. L-A4]